jgi:hypothetical protein
MDGRQSNAIVKRPVHHDSFPRFQQSNQSGAPRPGVTAIIS